MLVSSCIHNTETKLSKLNVMIFSSHLLFKYALIQNGLK